MKVLHIINQLTGGGRERRMAQTAKSLSALADVEQSVIAFQVAKAYPEIHEANLCIHEVNGSRIERITEYCKILKRFKPEIVHLWIDTPTETFFFSFMKRRMKYKLVLGFVADGNPILGNNIRSKGISYAFKNADAIVSNSMAGLLAKKAPMEKSIIIYNGFDFNRIQPIDRQEKRKSLGLDDEIAVVMCASMTRVKDWNSFLTLAEESAKVLQKVSYIGVGGGPLLEEYQCKVRNLGLSNIRLLGKRNDVEEILQAVDISILFTNNKLHAEGVSNSIMEAMAVGLPVIATEGGGTQEIIQDKINGYVIAPKDTKKALEIICNLIDNPTERKNVGEKAQKTILTKFKIEDKMGEYLTLYQSLC